MSSLVLHRVELVEVLPSHPISGFPGAYATTIVVTGGDGRFEISLHSDKPLEVKGATKYLYRDFPTWTPPSENPPCDHTSGRRFSTTGENGLRCGDCGEPVNA